MKLKPGLLYLLAFFSLVFFIHEIHDWAHVIAAKFYCKYWGSRAFDIWAPSPVCKITTTQLAFCSLAGPVVNYIFLWMGWSLLSPQNELDRRTLGFSLVFAALPFPRLLAAAKGGGDETTGLHQLFPHVESGHIHTIALIGLAIVTLLCLPPLIRAFLFLPGWVRKVVIFPAFLVIPGLVDQWLVHDMLNKLIVKNVFIEEQIPGIPLIVFGWFILLSFLCLFTFGRLYTLFEHKDLPL